MFKIIMEYTRNLSWLLGKESELQIQAINNGDSHVKDISVLLLTPLMRFWRLSRISIASNWNRH